MIERSKATLETKSTSTSQDGLLFLGNPQLVFPRLLFDDPVLEPVDRNVWAAIKLHAADGDSVTAFPTYEEIMLRCNIGSKATVSRSIAILRACRWLTVCKARLRDAKGRVKGNIYALHDEPLQLAETLELDDAYLSFLHETADRKQNPHPRVIGIAAAVLQGMSAQVVAGIDITELESPLLRRQQASVWRQEADDEGRFFAFTKSGIEKVNSRDYLKATKRTEVQKLYLVNISGKVPSTENVLSDISGKSEGGEYKNCTGVRGGSTETVLRSISSSNYIYKDTTTTTVTGVSTETVLAWPDSLQGNNQSLVAMQLRSLPESHHQPVIDALGATLAAIAKGHAKPLRSLLAYTRKLCELSLAGQLNPIVAIDAPTTKPLANADFSHPPENPTTTIQALNNLDHDIRSLQHLQKTEPENSPQWILFNNQIAAKKVEWYRLRDTLPTPVSA
jgi:hypothetical protein